MKRFAVLFVFLISTLISDLPGNVITYTGLKRQKTENHGLNSIACSDTLNNSDSLLFYPAGQFFIKYINDQGFVAFSKNGKKLFVVYPFDNGPDYPSEGLFRIIKGDKIGFANIKGEVVIPPRFNAVLPFHNGRAAFCDGCRKIQHGEHQAWEDGQWGFIDRKGNEVIRPVYDKIIRDFREGMATVVLKGRKITIDTSGNILKPITMEDPQWITLLGEAITLGALNSFQDSLKIKNSRTKVIPRFGALKPEALKTEVFYGNIEKPLLTFYFLPWQNLTQKINTDSPDEKIHPLRLITVTGYAMIFAFDDYTELFPKHKEESQRFEKFLKTLINYGENQQTTEEPLELPEYFQVISGNIFRNYISLEIAWHGSGLPADWTFTPGNKMLRIHLIPDRGPTVINWQKPPGIAPDSSFREKENKLIEIFDEALQKSFAGKENRETLYENAKNSIRDLLTGSDMQHNIDFYTTRLKNWMFPESGFIKKTGKIENFPDYTPKLSPDKATDYMPEVTDSILKLPESKPENFKRLLELFIVYSRKAKDNPGEWVEGNMVLGARPKEYQPTADELILAEIGDRLQKVMKTLPGHGIHKTLKKLNIKPGDLEYIRFSFIHVDVMGSGRFFYVDKMENIRLLVQ